jgi:PKD repeat protein
MKQLSIGLVLLIVIVSGCQKSGKDVTNSTASSAVTSPIAPAPPATANFKITNAVSPGNVWEALNLKIDNSSQNAESYLWDFGEGTTSTEKAPTNVALAPCGMTYTITLTVKNKDGQSSTFSVPYTVLCSRGMGYGAHGQ